jgi:hypothetical protein
MSLRQGFVISKINYWPNNLYPCQRSWLSEAPCSELVLLSKDFAGDTEGFPKKTPLESIFDIKLNIRFIFDPII